MEEGIQTKQKPRVSVEQKYYQQRYLVWANHEFPGRHKFRVGENLFSQASLFIQPKLPTVFSFVSGEQGHKESYISISIRRWGNGDGQQKMTEAEAGLPAIEQKLRECFLWVPRAKEWLHGVYLHKRSVRRLLVTRIVIAIRGPATSTLFTPCLNCITYLLCDVKKCKLWWSHLFCKNDLQKW